MEPFAYVGVDRVLNKIDRDYKGHNLSEIDLIEWIGEAMGHMKVKQNLEEAVAFVEVKNHRALIPFGTSFLIQIARNNSWNEHWNNANCEDNSILCPAQIVTDTDTETDTSAFTCDGTPVCLDCAGKPIGDSGYAYYRPYFDLHYEYYGWSHSRYFTENYTPVSLATHSFFTSLVCKETHSGTNSNTVNTGASSGDWHNQSNLDYLHHRNSVSSSGPYNRNADEYKVQAPYLTFSFASGSVAIAYLKPKTDPDTGYPMIPDEVSYTEAVASYIAYKMTKRRFIMESDFPENKVKLTEKDWHWYCRQAINKTFSPSGMEGMSKLGRTTQYMLPRDHYFDFFGRMSDKEDRFWNRRQSNY